MTNAQRGGPSFRSLLFVPGHKFDWMIKAPRFQPDALVIDLEDAVPIARKSAAREAVVEAIGLLSSQPVGLFVRANGWGTGELLKDLDAVVVPGLTGIVLSKPGGPADIAALDLALADIEKARSLPPGAVEIVPLLETANSLYRANEVFMASSRVLRAGMTILAQSDVDATRAVGVKPGPEFQEWVPIGAQTVLAARAAGIEHILGACVGEISNLALVRKLTEQSIRMGADGAYAIHPSHVAVLNELYAPSQPEIEKARGILEAMAGAVDRGDAAVVHEGRMIDYAHVRAALDVIGKARRYGIPVGSLPELDVQAYD